MSQYEKTGVRPGRKDGAHVDAASGVVIVCFNYEISITINCLSLLYLLIILLIENFQMTNA